MTVDRRTLACKRRACEIARAVSLAALSILLVVLALLCIAPAAFAAETEVSFGNLPAGTVVTDQYEAQGLKLGRAEELGLTPPAANGDCGPPTVAGGSPPSSNYAVLSSCSSPYIHTDYVGTYGELLGHPRETFSVEVGNLPGSLGATPTSVLIEVVGYNSSGIEVAKARGEVGFGEWHRFALPPSEGHLSFFAIRTAVQGPFEIAINNLIFGAGGTEPPSEEPGRGETPPPPPKNTSPPPPPPPPPTPPPPPPRAQLALLGANPKPGQELTLSGAGSEPGSGHIVAYDWDLDGDGKDITSTGADPDAEVMFKPGLHEVGVTVINSSGETASASLPVDVGTPAKGEQFSGVSSNVPLAVECNETTYSEGDVEITAECIQKTSPGNYVIATKELELNGMMLVPRVPGRAIFSITTTGGLAAATELSGPAVNVELLDTPEGTIVLGGRELKSEPIKLASSFKPLAKKAGEETAKKYLMYIGVGHKCNAKEESEEGTGVSQSTSSNETSGNEAGEKEKSKSKKAGCCPPAQANTLCGELPGKFPVTGHIAISLNSKKQAVLSVNVGLSLEKIIEAEGELELLTDPQSGTIELQSLEFKIKEAGFASVFELEDVTFKYFWPGDVAAGKEKENSWEATGKISFGPSSGKFEVAISFRKGNFYSASLGLKLAQGQGIPIFPGIELNKLGANVTTANPLSFGGNLGASIAAELELVIKFQYAEAAAGAEGYFKGAGELELENKKFAALEVLVGFSGYVKGKVELNLKEPETNPVIELAAGIGFWDETEHKPAIWQAEGNVKAKFKVPGFTLGALLDIVANSKDVAACGEAEFLTWHGGLAGLYNFKKSQFEGPFLFETKTCSEELKPFEEVPATKHATSSSAHDSTSSRPDSAGAHGPAGEASDASESFTLPSGSKGEELRINSPSGTPVVTLTSPNGESFTTPQAPAQVAGNAKFISSLSFQNPDQVVVLLEHPQGGEWHIEANPGSAPIGKLEVAGLAPAASIRAHVRHAHGQWTLSYKIAHHVAGTDVRFSESGPDGVHVLATVSGASGTVSFTPKDAAARKRTILAYVINAEGIATRTLTVGHYIAPAPLRGGRVGHLRIIRHGSDAVIAWSAATNTREYKIRVKGSDGRLQTLIRAPGSRSVSVANVLPFESFTATVAAVGGPNMLPGKPATVRLAAVKLHRHPAKHRS